MEYISRDFENMLINVYKHKLGTDLFRVFPILSKYEEFRVNLHAKYDIEKVIRYVVFSFDPNSPLVAINDIVERRVEAALLAGFVPAKATNNLASHVDEMIKSIVPKINHMVIRYCMLQGNTDYSVMVTYEDSLIKELKRLADFGNTESKKDDSSSEKKSALIANITTLRKNINELRDLFFVNNVDHFLARSLSEFSESKKVDLSPEFYAEKLKGWNNISRHYKTLSKGGI